MTPHLPAILAAMLLVWLPLILGYVALRALFRRWTGRRLADLPPETKFLALHVWQASNFGGLR